MDINLKYTNTCDIHRKTATKNCQIHIYIKYVHYKLFNDMNRRTEVLEKQNEWKETSDCK